MLTFTDDERLLGKYKTCWTEIVNFKNIAFNAQPVYDNRYLN